MNKVIISLVVLVVVGVGIGGFFLLGSEDDTEDSAVTNQSSDTSDTAANETGSDGSEKTIAIGAITDPYTVNVTTDGESSGTITVKYESPERAHTTISAEGQTSETIIYDGDVYILMDGQWTKYPTAQQSNTPDYSATFGFDNDNYKELYSKSAYQGTEDCGGQTCDVFTSKDPESNSSVTVKVLNNPQRIYSIEGIGTGENATSTATIMYDYDSPVNVSPPASFEEFNIPGLSGAN